MLSRLRGYLTLEPISDEELADEIKKRTAAGDLEGDWLYSLERKQKIIAGQARQAIYYRRGPLPKLVQCVGFVVRWSFFTAYAIALYAYYDAQNWSAYHTRFADLTISKIVELVLKLALISFFGCLLWKWVFDSGKTKAEHYTAWAKTAWYGSLIGFALYRLIEKHSH